MSASNNLNKGSSAILIIIFVCLKVQKLDLFPRENVFSEEDLVGETSSWSFKLFGRTVLVSECPGPSSPTIGNSKLSPLATNDGKHVQPLPLNFMGTELQHENRECTWNHFSTHDLPGALCYLQFQKEKSNSIGAGSSAPVPLYAICGGVPFHFHKRETMKIHLDPEEIQDKEIHKEGSWTGSNSGSVNGGENVDKNIDGETQSRQLPYEGKESYPVLELKTSEKTATSSKCLKGFVPYKKRKAERDCQSSSITGEEREERRIRLCL